MIAPKRFLRPALILTLVATFLLAACTGDDPTPTSPPTSTTSPTATSPAPTVTAMPGAMMPVSPGDVLIIALNELNGSGQSGWATLTRRGDDTEAVLFLTEGTMTSNLVHIHSGQCDSLGSIANPLTGFADGASVTLLEGVPLDGLLTGGFAVNAHNADDPSTFTACGSIPLDESADMMPSSTATAEPTATPKPTTCPESLSAQSVCLNPGKDNTLFKDDSGSISNGAGEHLFVGNNITEQTRRAVIAFDIAASIPPGIDDHQREPGYAYVQVGHG